MLTPQSNTTLGNIAKQFCTLDDFVICGHVSPDGDCLGSQLALSHVLRALGKRSVCVLAKPDPIEECLKFLPGIEDMLCVSDYDGDVGVFVAVDVPSVERIAQAHVLQAAAALCFTIDHHASEAVMSQYNYIDPDAASTSMLIWELAKLLDVVTPEVAQCCLCGLITDTGSFAYQNTDAQAFLKAGEMCKAGADPALINREVFQSRTLPSIRLEQRVLERMEFSEGGEFVCSYLQASDFDECGAIRADAEPLINVLRSVSGVRVACILREKGSGDVRGSLRAKDDSTDVSGIARIFAGGGHKAAAGFTFHGSLTQALEELPRVVHSLCFFTAEDSDV